MSRLILRCGMKSCSFTEEWSSHDYVMGICPENLQQLQRKLLKK